MKIIILIQGVMVPLFERKERFQIDFTRNNSSIKRNDPVAVMMSFKIRMKEHFFLAYFFLLSIYNLVKGRGELCRAIFLSSYKSEFDVTLRLKCKNEVKLKKVFSVSVVRRL